MQRTKQGPVQSWKRFTIEVLLYRYKNLRDRRTKRDQIRYGVPLAFDGKHRDGSSLPNREKRLAAFVRYKNLRDRRTKRDQIRYGVPLAFDGKHRDGSSLPNREKRLAAFVR
ncbi:hypothetical protein DY000_02004990 [Brassica cretica]|uniref:Uncharacterized protein n=1 Tax=Brassica cretica TaxID=69181 RepID=A0ABQ7C3R0_BRACR|nr:hypothetical protein DY000_02004990 [Brassica cretica]